MYPESNKYEMWSSLLQRYPTDRPYFIAKEILMTERTYKKDLEIVNLVRTGPDIGKNRA